MVLLGKTEGFQTNVLKLFVQVYNVFVGLSIDHSRALKHDVNVLILILLSYWICF